MRVNEVMEVAEESGSVAETELKAASAAPLILRYTPAGLASQLRLLHRFAPADLLDAAIRKKLRLDASKA